MFVGNTLNEHDFKTIIDVAIKERESYILNKNSMIIDTNPRIANAINLSSMLSSNSLL